MEIQETKSEYEYKRSMQKKKKKFKKRLMWLKFILLSVMSIITLMLLALSPLFNLTKIEVEGTQKYKSEDIIKVTGIIMGSNGFKTIGSSVKNILTFRLGKAEQEIIKEFPYIKEANVKYIIPGRIKIVLTERIPVGIIPFNGTNLIIDGDGYVADAVNSLRGVKLPVIKGMRFDNFILGQPLKLENEESLKNLNKILKAIEASDSTEKFKVKDLISFLDVGESKKIRMNLESRITVNFGDLSDIDYRLTFLKQIYTKNLKKEDKGTLDFSTGDNPGFTPEKK